jgi:glycerol uptake facilitator-like aquaporin
LFQQLQLLAKNKLDRNKKIFFAELIGTFTVIVFATGSVVLDAKLNDELGLPFIAIALLLLLLLEFIFLVKHRWHISILQLL